MILVGRNDWLDVDDPAVSVDAGFEIDPDTRKLDGLLRAWRAEFGSTRQLVKALRPFANDHKSGLFDALDEIGVIERGELNPRRMGRWIEARVGRFVEGLRFVRDGFRDKTIMWRVEALNDNYSRSEKRGGLMGYRGFLQPKVK